MLKQVANASGKDSEAYRKQEAQLNKTATSIAKTKDEMKSLRGTVPVFSQLESNVLIMLC